MSLRASSLIQSEFGLSGKVSEYLRIVATPLVTPTGQTIVFVLPRSITQTNSGCPGAVSIKPSVKALETTRKLTPRCRIRGVTTLMCVPADPVPDDPESRRLLARVLLHKALETILFYMTRAQLGR